MKKDIHPKIHKEVTVRCACGNEFITSSTVESIQVDICSKCHPFYTGKQKFIDTEGRIDKFNKKRELAKTHKAKAKAKKRVKAKAPTPKTLKEMMKEATKATKEK